MRFIAVALTFGTIYIVNFYGITNGQHPDYPELFYTPIRFDYAIRGGFNISECMKELLTCWELVRADEICHHAFGDWNEGRYDVRHRESVCSFMRDVCHDLYGDMDIVWFQYTLFENTCHWWMNQS